MPSCLRLSSTSTADTYVSPPASQANTPRSSAQLSSTVNLSPEYARAVQTNSYSEIWRTFHRESSYDQNSDLAQAELEEPQLLEEVLQPSHECIQEALLHVRPDALTQLVAGYFEHSEHTTRLCFDIYQNIHRAHILYSPILKLLDSLPVDLDSESFSLTLSQFNWAFDIFLEFDQLDNPFISSSSHNFNDIRECFSQLKEQLDQHLHKSRSRIHLIRRAYRGSALCLIAAAIGVVVSAVVIASHALVALVAIPACSGIQPSNITRKEMAHMAQLDAAAKGTYVLHNDLDTIDRLVARLCTAVENDKLLIRFALERGRDRHSVQEVLKHLRKNISSFVQQLTDLEEHVFLCFAAINRARSLLYKEICLHQIDYAATTVNHT